MRALLQAKVLESALVASLILAVLSYPRFCLAPQRQYAIWYLEAVQFLGGTVLWGFAFAWYSRYTARPLFTLRVSLQTFISATLSGLAIAAFHYFCQDSALRKVAPLDYPANPAQWAAMTLFHLGFVQLFLILAPFAWLMRLFQRKNAAIVMTVLFGVFTLLVRSYMLKRPAPTGLVLESAFVLVCTTLLSLHFLLRGGVWLVCWFSLVIQGRLLLEM